MSDVDSPEALAPWPDDELDRLYQQAVEAMDAVDWAAAEPRLGESGLAGDDDKTDATAVDDKAPASLSSLEAIAAGLLVERPGGRVAPGDQAAVLLPMEGRSGRVSPKQVIEAALFVGGGPLTTRKLCQLLRSEFESGFVEDRIDELNAQYAAENRPYEIRLGEGGYRMVLRAEHEGVRNRTFGLGAREVKLSQESLEVLAVVAYQQPISREQIETLGKAGAGGVLRQLLRRELIAIDRTAGDGKEVRYRTSPRFLQVFGLGDIEELPQAGELDFK